MNELLNESYLKNLALQGDAAAKLVLGVMHHGGFGVPVDIETAIAWYEAAGEDGIGLGFLAASRLLYERVPKNFSRAEDLLRKAAEKGIPTAMYELGLALEGKANSEDQSKEFVKWYRKAAENGHAKAACRVAEQSDEKGAAEWYALAARLGDPHAAYMLSTMFNGHAKNIAIDNEKSREWLEIAAAEGHVAANLQLSLATATGQMGYKRDMVRSKFHEERAARLQRLESIEKAMRRRRSISKDSDIEGG